MHSNKNDAYYDDYVKEIIKSSQFSIEDEATYTAAQILKNMVENEISPDKIIEKTYYRIGEPVFDVYSGEYQSSYNFAGDYREDGVSVVTTGWLNSMKSVFFGAHDDNKIKNKGIYKIKGIEIAKGGDGEPLIYPTGYAEKTDIKSYSELEETVGKGNGDIKYSKNGFIKTYNQREKTVYSLEKHLEKFYAEDTLINNIPVEFDDIEVSHAPGSFETFYINFTIDNSDNFEIRYSGHWGKTDGIDAGITNDSVSSLAELYSEVDRVVKEYMDENYTEDGTFKDNEWKKEHDIKYSKNTDSEGNSLTEEQDKYFKDSKVRDDKGNLKVVYHGTARADRVGYYFNPERATSGPMAFFTDNKQIAENYSRSKQDTSIAYDSEYDSYETQFRVPSGNSTISIVDYWNKLNQKSKSDITEKIKQVKMDDDYENVIVDKNNKVGIGNVNDYEMHAFHGNALAVLVDGWLGGGTLFGEEEKFLDVLKAVGIENAIYKNPDFRDEKVYNTYLNITNPFSTADINEDFIADCRDYVDATDMTIYENENFQADMWDKRGIDIEDWLEKLEDDFTNGTTHAWTSIPDVVTDFLKEYGGYDGIKDTGGKNGGEIHTVWIPFYSNQIKQTDNLNPTENEDIRFSKYIDDFDETEYNYPNLSHKEYMHLSSEIIKNFPNVIDEINSIYLISKNKKYIYKMDEDKTVFVYGRYTIKNINKGDKTNADGKRNGFSKRFKDAESGFIDNRNSDIGIDNTETTRRNDRNVGTEISRKEEGNQRRSSQNGNNADLPKENKFRKSLNDTRTADELVKENESLKAALTVAKNELKVTDGHRLNEKQIDSMAIGILKKTSSSYDKAKLTGNLTKIFDYIANSDEANYDVAIDAMADLSKAVISESSVLDKSLYEEYADMRKYFRETAIVSTRTFWQINGNILLLILKKLLFYYII